MALSPKYGVRRMCALVDLPLSSWYYQPKGRVNPASDAQIIAALHQIAGRHVTYGYRRLWMELKRRPTFKDVGKTRVQRLTQTAGIQAHKPSRRVATTQSQHGFRRYPNLVLGRIVTRPDEVWACDITYIILGSGEVVYLAIVLDVFTRMIRGWALGQDLSHLLPLTALRRALRMATPEIHHSDQGVQYATPKYTAELESRGVLISMADVGQAWQNGYAERWIRTLKEEEVYVTEYDDYPDARKQIGHFIDAVYNLKRIHSALGYLSPKAFETSWRRAQHD